MSKISLKRRAAAALDLAVELDEGHVELLRQQAAERRLAAAAQADQRDARGAQVVGRLAEMLAARSSRASASACGGSRSRNCESSTRSSGGSAASLTSCVTGRPMARAIRRSSTIEQLPLPALELRQIALRHFGVLRQRLARHAALVAQRAHALAEAAQIGVGVAAAAAAWRAAWVSCASAA